MQDICRRTLSVPRSEHFSEGVARGKLCLEKQIMSKDKYPTRLDQSRAERKYLIDYNGGYVHVNWCFQLLIPLIAVWVWVFDRTQITMIPSHQPTKSSPNVI